MYVGANGRIDELGIFDHGSRRHGQQLGNYRVNASQFQDLASLLEDGAETRLFGCWGAIAIDANVNGVYDDRDSDGLPHGRQGLSRK